MVKKKSKIASVIVKKRKQQKPLTKSQVIDVLSDQTQLTRKQVSSVLEGLVSLAYANANVGFTIHGLGKLVVVHRKARMGRNPATGEKIRIKAKKVLKFRISKIAKDSIL